MSIEGLGGPSLKEMGLKDPETDDIEGIEKDKSKPEIKKEKKKVFNPSQAELDAIRGIETTSENE
jgi:hypothetical protein